MTKAMLLAGCSAATLLAAPVKAQTVAAVNPAAASTPQEDAAAPSDAVADDIVVTARRRSERLQDVPVAVSAVGAESLRTQTVIRLEDLSRVVPGFGTTQSTRGSSTPNYALRGQRGALTQTLLVDPAVAIYFGEVNLSRGTGTNQTVYDVASVQILRGPQGTLFGRNSTGGAVLIEPNRPSQEFEGYLQASAGNYDFHDLEAMVNLPLGSDLALRAAGKISRRDGYLVNVVNGQRANDLRTESGRLSLRYNPNATFDTNFIGTYFHGGGVGTATKIFRYLPAYLPANLGASRPAVQALIQREFDLSKQLGRYEYRGIDTSSRDEAWSIQNNTTVTLGSSGFLGDLVLKNVIGVRAIDNNYFTDFSGTALDIYYQTGPIHSRQFSEELQLQGTLPGLRYIAGLYYFRESGYESILQVQNAPAVRADVLAGLPPTQRTAVLAANPRYAIRAFDAVNTSYAAFAQFDYELNPAMSVTLGGRITRDKRIVDFHNISYQGVSPTSYTCDPAGTPVSAPNTELCNVSYEISTTQPTYNVSLNFKPAPDILLYAAHRLGYRSGGFNATPPAPPTTAGRSFEPETVRDIELGLKSRFSIGGVRTTFNTAVYHQWYQDIQRSVSFVNPTTGILTVNTINATSAKVFGLETELQFQFSPNFSISANYAYVNPRYDDFIDNRVIGGVVTAIDISDSRFAFIPQHQFNVGFQARLVESATLGDISLTGNLSYQSDQATAEVNTDNCGPNNVYTGCVYRQAELDGYTLMNLRLDWHNVASTGFDLGLFVNNVTNKFYRNFALNGLPSLGFASASIGAPRMVGMELRLPFGAMARR